MTQGEKQNRVWDKLMQSKDRAAAMRTLVEDWERPKHPEADIAKRLTHANAWERAFSEQSTGVDKDISAKANYSKGMIDDPQGFIVHHTGGRGTAEGVVNTLNQRGLGVQFVIDRDGNIVRTLPEGARGAHILPSKINGLSNANAIGVEVVAKDDKDVTDKQIAAVKKLYEDQARKYPGIRGNVFGHGEVNPGHKQASEGMSSVAAIRADREMQARLEGQRSPESKKWANIIGSARAAQLYDQSHQVSPLPPRPIGHVITNHSFGDTILNQKTSINVTTPGDAGAAARAIAGVQTRVNADAIRNMQGAAH